MPRPLHMVIRIGYYNFLFQQLCRAVADVADAAHTPMSYIMTSHTDTKKIMFKCEKSYSNNEEDI